MRLIGLGIIGILPLLVNSQPLQSVGIVRLFAVTETGQPIDHASVRIEGAVRQRTVELRGATSIELPFGVYTMACIHPTLATQFKVVRVEKPASVDVIFGLPLANPGQVFGEGDFSPFEVVGRALPPPAKGIFARVRVNSIFTEDSADSIIDEAGRYRILLRNEGAYRISVIREGSGQRAQSQPNLRHATSYRA